MRESDEAISSSRNARFHGVAFEYIDDMHIDLFSALQLWRACFRMERTRIAPYMHENARY